jgi:rod shape-determining protein MreB
VTRVVPEPLAAAIGAGVDISSEYAQLIVDIGDGVTDAAVISNGTICRSSAIRFGCAEIRRSVSEWLLWQREITVDDDAADRIVRAYCAGESRDDDLGAVIDPALDTISAFVAGFLRGLPDSLAVEVIESGVHLTGGGSLLRALVKKIESATRLRAFRAADPLHAVVAGARAMLSA